MKVNGGDNPQFSHLPMETRGGWKWWIFFVDTEAILLLLLPSSASTFYSHWENVSREFSASHRLEAKLSCPLWLYKWTKGLSTMVPHGDELKPEGASTVPLLCSAQQWGLISFPQRDSSHLTVDIDIMRSNAHTRLSLESMEREEIHLGHESFDLIYCNRIHVIRTTWMT